MAVELPCCAPEVGRTDLAATKQAGLGREILNLEVNCGQHLQKIVGVNWLTEQHEIVVARSPLHCTGGITGQQDCFQVSTKS